MLSQAASGGRPVVVRLGVSYGYGQGYLERLFVQPARARGTVRYIGSSANHWSLVHVEDIAELYVLALEAPAGTVYNGVSEERPSVGEIALSLSRAAGCPGQTASMTLEEARQEMGPFADAFALDQQISAARARTQLRWRPAHHNMLEELAQPQRAQEASAGAARG